jgi:hypothetical protein
LGNRPNSQLDGYLDLPGLAAYSCMSERSLRDYINAVSHPLPAYRPGGKGKLLVKRSEFDRWLAQWKQEGGSQAAHVEAILAKFRTPGAPKGRNGR